MAKIAGVLLRSTDTFIRFLEFLASAAILGIFSYFLACLARGSLPIAIWMRAVEGIAGAATLYTLLGVILTFFLGGITVFAFLGILLDLAFCGAFGYVAYATRGGIHCGGSTDESFFGNGNTGIGNSSASPRVICDLEKTCFILAIILCGLFLLSAVFQLALWMNHKKEKKYGPGPSNGYTSGSGKRSRFGRSNKKDAALAAPVIEQEAANTHPRHRDRDIEMGATDIRPSADTAVEPGTAYGGQDNKYFKEPNRDRHSTTYPEPTVPVMDGKARHASPRQARQTEDELVGSNMHSVHEAPISPPQPALNANAVHLEPPTNTDAGWVHEVSNNPANTSLGSAIYPGQNSYGRAQNY
ncbi:hypothetical protein MMC13_001913 [Lambiella insularis]|nr:hypothetical protein [Lambiella insularis]